MISEIEIIHLLERDEAEFKDSALLSACLVRRGWANRMPAKYQAMINAFIQHGIVRNETTEVTQAMKPRIRFICEDGQPTIAESIGCPIEVTVVDKTHHTTVIYTTHEGESHPVPLMGFDPDDGEEKGEDNVQSGEV
jgi:hypothetical protein|tara:strand:+ start:1465 stop:1875 length:411 start_codon:yes stop_codon:yes gene_type:complete